jgi:hypothetical protein
MLQREHLAIVSALLTAMCVVPYLRDTLRGTTRPQRVSWFVFALLSTVAAISQFLGGGGAGAWLALGGAVGFGLVFIASIPRGVGGFSVVDVGALTIAMIGIATSITTRDPIVAVVAVVSAEIGAIALTARKAMHDPTSETTSTWVLDLVAGVVAVAALTAISFDNLLYPTHHIAANAAVLTAIAVGHARKVQSRVGLVVAAN